MNDNDTAPLCPIVEAAFGLVGKKWIGLIVHVLGTTSMRYSELLAEIPEMSSRILAERLKELECVGIVKRTVVPDIPVRVEYSLTPKGVELLPVMKGLADWAYAWSDSSGEALRNERSRGKTAKSDG